MSSNQLAQKMAGVLAGITIVTLAVVFTAEKDILTLNTPEVQAQDSDTETAPNYDIELIVESAGYIPPSYEGSPPVTTSTPFTITALGGPADFTYQWNFAGRRMHNLSGPGKIQAQVNGIDRQLRILLELVSPSGAVVEREAVTVDPDTVELALYQDHPLRGTLLSYQLPSAITTNASSLNLQAVVYGSNQIDPGVDWSVGRNLLSVSPRYVLTRTPGFGTELVVSYDAGFNQVDTRELLVKFR